MKIFFFLYLFFSILIGADAKESVSLAITEYPPYTSKKLPGYGVVAEIVKTAFAHAGYGVNFHIAPFKRVLKEVETGNYDGIFIIWARKDRKRLFLFSDPIFTVKLGFFKLTNKKIDYKNIEDLKQYVIGTVRGYSYPQKFIDANLKIEMVNSNRLNILKLNKKRIDLILMPKMMGRYLIKNIFPDNSNQIEWLEPTLKEENEYLAISKKAKQAQAKVIAFNLGLNKIKNNGIYNQILDKYNTEL